MQKEKEAVLAKEEEETKDGHGPLESLPPLPDETVAPVAESSHSAADASTSNPLQGSDSLFLPSATFTGPKAGFVFKLGDSGQGKSLG